MKGADDISMTAAFNSTVQTHPAGGTERLLVVEDEATVRRLAFTMLESHGYEVAEADVDRTLRTSAFRNG